MYHPQPDTRSVPTQGAPGIEAQPLTAHASFTDPQPSARYTESP